MSKKMMILGLGATMLSAGCQHGLWATIWDVSMGVFTILGGLGGLRILTGWQPPI